MGADQGMFVNWVMGKPANTHGNLSHKNGDVVMKQDAAHEPECSHVKHFCETSDLNSVAHFSPVTVPVHCRLWDPEEGGVQSAECKV